MTSYTASSTKTEDRANSIADQVRDDKESTQGPERSLPQAPLARRPLDCRGGEGCEAEEITTPLERHPELVSGSTSLSAVYRI